MSEAGLVYSPFFGIDLANFVVCPLPAMDYTLDRNGELSQAVEGGLENIGLSAGAVSGSFAGCRG